MREILYRKDQAEDKGAVMEVKDYPPYLDYPKPRRPQTNGDRIRAMTDEELAEFVCSNSLVADTTLPIKYADRFEVIGNIYDNLELL